MAEKLSLWKAISGMRLENLGKDANLYSYITLKGTWILCLKLAELSHVERKSICPRSNKSGDTTKKEYAGEKYTASRERLLVEISKNSGEIAKSLFGFIKKSLDETRDALKANGYMVKECQIMSSYRVIAGVEEPIGKIPFEVGLFLDPLLGIPYIPGSSLKGAFRHGLEAIENSDKASWLFGSEEGIGLVGVTDAYPVKVENAAGRLFEPDVITPHYPGTSTELDVKPTPATFLTIAPGVVFKFYIFYKEKAREYVLEGGASDGAPTLNKLRLIDRAVLYALAKGVGAKTSVGYSRFELISYKDA